MKVSKHLEDIFSEGQKQFANTVTQYLLETEKIAAMKHGEKAMLENGITVVAIQAESGAQNKNLLEAHKVFNDLHYTLQGKDTISYKQVADCTQINKEYVDDGDYILYDEAPVETVSVEENTFCFIPNNLAHMALYENTGAVRKLVFKIPAQ
jgi:YhcH/YjgK/YiaL family protein